MHPSLPPAPSRSRSDRSGRDRGGPGAYLWITCGYVTAMALSGAPAALYPIYERDQGFDAFTVSIVFAIYNFAVLLSLFAIAHLSDRFGRRKTMLAGLGIAAASIVVFCAWVTLPAVLAGRVLCGISVAVIASTATAWFTDLRLTGHSPALRAARPEVISAGANLAGVGVGALIAGLAATVLPQPLRLPYLCFLPLLVVSGLMIARAPETAPRAAPRPYRPQQFAIPSNQKALFYTAAAGALTATGCLAFFSSLGPGLLSAAAGNPSPLALGAIVLVAFVTAGVTQSLIAGRDPRAVLGCGLFALPAGLAVVILTLLADRPSVTLFLAGSAICGAGAGMVFRSCLSIAIAVSPPTRRAEISAAIFLFAYLNGLPMIALGYGIGRWDETASLDLFLIAAVLASALLALTLLLVMRGRGLGASPQSDIARSRPSSQVS